MREFTTTVTRKGQITVPVEVRRSLGLKEGDKVAVTMPEPGSREATIRPATSVADRTFGILQWHGRPFSVEEMREAHIDGVVDEAIAENDCATISQS